MLGDSFEERKKKEKFCVEKSLPTCYKYLFICYLVMNAFALNLRILFYTLWIGVLEFTGSLETNFFHDSLLFCLIILWTSTLIVRLS